MRQISMPRCNCLYSMLLVKHHNTTAMREMLRGEGTTAPQCNSASAQSSVDVPHRTTPHHTVPRHTTPYHTAPHRTTPYHTIPHRTTPHHTAPQKNYTIKPGQQHKPLSYMSNQGRWNTTYACEMHSSCGGKQPAARLQSKRPPGDTHLPPNSPDAHTNLGVAAKLSAL